MNDEEWKAWQAGWRDGTVALPDVRGGVRRGRLTLVAANVVFMGLVIGEACGAVRAWRSGARAVGAGLLAFIAVFAILYASIQRGLWREVTQTPAGLVDYLERRLGVEARAAQLVRWGGLVICAFTAWIVWRKAGFQPRPALFVSGTLLLTVTAPWWTRLVLARAHQKVAHWRSQLK